MTFDEFNKYQGYLHKEIADMTQTKGKEYANGDDRFGNFNRTAVKKGVSRLAVAGIFLDKHLDAIDSYIKNGRTFSTEHIRGRIIDAILYLELIGGMIDEDESLQKGIAQTGTK